MKAHRRLPRQQHARMPLVLGSRLSLILMLVHVPRPACVA